MSDLTKISIVTAESAAVFKQPLIRNRSNPLKCWALHGHFN